MVLSQQWAAQQMGHILLRSRWPSSIEDSRPYRGTLTEKANSTDCTNVHTRFKLHLSVQQKTRPHLRIDLSKQGSSSVKCDYIYGSRD